MKIRIVQNIFCDQPKKNESFTNLIDERIKSLEALLEMVTRNTERLERLKSSLDLLTIGV